MLIESDLPKDFSINDAVLPSTPSEGTFPSASKVLQISLDDDPYAAACLSLPLSPPFVGVDSPSIAYAKRSLRSSLPPSLAASQACGALISSLKEGEQISHGSVVVGVFVCGARMSPFGRVPRLDISGGVWVKKSDSW